MEEIFYTYDEACKFFEECKKDKSIIYGIERFIEVEDGFTPDMDGIADFSDATFEESIKSSKNFLDHFQDGLFTFVTSKDIS